MLINPLNILCFGDSLTAGLTKHGMHLHPYSGALRSSLEGYIPSMTVITDLEGQSGDLATSPPGQFLPRMNTLYAPEGSNIPYDWAVVLGGTNDLGWGNLADPTYEALQKVWNIPLSHGTKVLALTVPECGACNPSLDERRDALNKHIKDHKAENYYVLDLYAAIPYWNLTDDQRAELWDDGIHFTEAGYDLMGSYIADRINELILEIERAEIKVTGDVLQKQKPLVEKIKEGGHQRGNSARIQTIWKELLT